MFGLNIKSIYLLYICLSISLVGYSNPKRVILDTDMDSDIDDVAALALLHYFAELGEVEILATVSCSSDIYSVRLIDAINNFYNRPNIPVGIPNIGAPKHSWILNGAKLSDMYKHTATSESSPSATEIYRKILAAQPDGSVTIISLGYLNNLYDVLNSEPDEFSALNGMDLVALKVESYYCMGGSYPTDAIHEDVKYGNFRPDPISTSYVVNHWPTKIIFTGGGDFAESITHGNGLKNLSEDNIVRKAYEMVKGSDENDWSHHSADILTVWLAVRGAEPFFTKISYGYNSIDKYGRNTWLIDKDNPKHMHISQLKEDIHPETISSFFDKQLKNLSGFNKQTLSE